MDRLRIESKSGSVHVVAEAGATLTVEGADIESQDDGSVLVRAAKGGSKSVSVRCPAGTDLVIGTKSGSVRVEGHAGATRIATHSGSIDVEHASSVDARTASGSVTVDVCDAECRAVVASGSIDIGEAGLACCASVSGHVRAGEVDRAEVKTISGTVEVGVRGTGRVAIKSVSGTVEVTVPQERAPAARLRSISGKIRSECPIGTDGELDIKTVSGTIRVACQ